MITLIEYDSASKPTGRICRLPNDTRDTLAALLPLYGCEKPLSCGQITLSAERFIFVYQSSMSTHPGVLVELADILSGADAC